MPGIPADDVADLLIQALGDSLDEEGALVETVGNSLVVRHSQEMHRKIEKLLIEIRVWGPEQPGLGSGGGFGGGFGGGGGLGGGQGGVF